MMITRLIFDGYKLILTSLLVMGISTFTSKKMSFFAGYPRLAMKMITVIRLYPLVNVNKKLWKITMLLMGKSTISTGPFSIASLQHDTLWLFNIAMDIAHL